MDAHKDIKRIEGPVGMLRTKHDSFKLVLYTNRADQEFTGLRPYMWGDWDNEMPWDNNIAWDNVDWPKSSSKPVNLSDIIQIREEGGFGFVRNLVTGMVFYADANALELIKNIKDMPLEKILKELPIVLREIGYKDNITKA